MKDPTEAARELVAERFAGADWAILTGSVLGPHRTAGSDLDIVVMQREDPGHRESLHFRGWPVELFVHTPVRLEEILAREFAARKPSTHRMLAHGVTVAGDAGELPVRCARVLAQGPAPLTTAEKDRMRYGLTDLLDDHRHASDPGERSVVAAALWLATGEAALAFAGRWVSHGKWLLRELTEFDPALAASWLAARADPAELTVRVLDGAGGPLFDGYRA